MTSNPYVATLIEMGYDEQDCRKVAAAIRMSVAKCECIDDYGNSYINSQDLLNIANELADFLNGM